MNNSISDAINTIAAASEADLASYVASNSTSRADFDSMTATVSEIKKGADSVTSAIVAAARARQYQCNQVKIRRPDSRSSAKYMAAYYIVKQNRPRRDEPLSSYTARLNLNMPNKFAARLVNICYKGAFIVESHPHKVSVIREK